MDKLAVDISTGIYTLLFHVLQNTTEIRYKYLMGAVDRFTMVHVICYLILKKEKKIQKSFTFLLSVKYSSNYVTFFVSPCVVTIPKF